MIMLWNWLGEKFAGLFFAFAALTAIAGFAWQSGRIEGWPFFGDGFKAEVAGLTQQLQARDLADVQARAAMLVARQKLGDAGAAQARAYAAAAALGRTQIETVIREVPKYVTPKNDSACPVPWGFVRLLDAAAGGADPDSVRAALAPGVADDAASDVTLSEALALLATDLGIARENADQLTHLQNAVRAADKD